MEDEPAGSNHCMVLQLFPAFQCVATKNKLHFLCAHSVTERGSFSAALLRHLHQAPIVILMIVVVELQLTAALDEINCLIPRLGGQDDESDILSSNETARAERGTH